MKIAKLRIYIIPENIDVKLIQNSFKDIRDEFKLSDNKFANCIPDDYGYIIIYQDSVFKNLNIKSIFGRVAKTLLEKYPDYEFHVKLISHNKLDYRNDSLLSEKIDNFYETIEMLSKLTKNRIIISSDAIAQSSNNMNENILDQDEDNDDNSHNDSVDHQQQEMYNFLLNSEQEGKRKNRHKNRRKSKIKSSKILKENNSEKAFKKYNVLLTKKKSDIKKDANIIKSFLKDFIPGSAKWKKKLRKELLQRWLTSYAVSKKKLKKFSKLYNKKLDNDDCNDKTLLELSSLFQTHE